MRNKLHDFCSKLRVGDETELRAYIDRHGLPEPFPDPPPPLPRPPPSPEFIELMAERELAWELLEALAKPTPENCQKAGLDLTLLRSSPEAYAQEWFKCPNIWPGGEFRPQSPDEALLALLLRREVSWEERFHQSSHLLIILDSEDPRLDAEARGRIFWALELEPKFAYWSRYDGSFPPRPSQIDSRYRPGGSEHPRTRLRPHPHNLYTNLPYTFPNGEEHPSSILHACGLKPNNPGFPPPHGITERRFSIERWEGPDKVSVSVGVEYGPLCGNGRKEELHRHGDSWRSVEIGRWVS